MHIHSSMHPSQYISQVKRNVELELEAVHALQEQGVPIQHVNEEDGNGSDDEVISDAATHVGGSGPLNGLSPTKNRLDFPTKLHNQRWVRQDHHPYWPPQQYSSASQGLGVDSMEGSVLYQAPQYNT